MAGTVRVLAIDGGGIRGVVPAILLKHIEDRTGEPIANLFDLIVGTSTGGIIALGLVTPGADGLPKYTADQILDLYFTHGAKIFPPALFPIGRKLHDLWDERYNAAPLERVLKTYFGESMLSQAIRSVVVTAYDIEAQKPQILKSWRATIDPARDVLMRDAARGTSAAPTYFEPAKIPIASRTKYLALIDGGVAAGNPALCGLAEARRLFPQARNHLVVSLGTGKRTRTIAYDEAKDWGLASWARPILEVVFDGVSDVVDYQLEHLLNEGRRTRWFYRFNRELTFASSEMDDASEDNLHKLALDAAEIVSDQRKEFEALFAHLAKLGPATLPYQLG